MSDTLVIARYVSALEIGSKTTHRAEDRDNYKSLLADAAALLACSCLNGSLEDLRMRVSTHERLRGQTWLEDPAHKDSSSIWQEVVAAVSNTGI